MIYKYKSLYKENFKQHLEILQNYELYFGMGKKLNDPFEGQIIGNQTIQNLFQNSGICSFSRVNDNLLMWSHYGNAHNGLCYGFDKALLIESIWKGISATGETYYEHGDVLYTSSPPNVIGEKFEDYQAKDIIFHKSLGWAYEQEYRIVATPRKAKFDSKALKKVFIGAHVPIWHPEFKPISDALSLLAEDVIIGIFELHKTSYGLVCKEAYSPGAFKIELEKRKNA